MQALFIRSTDAGAVARSVVPAKLNPRKNLNFPALRLKIKEVIKGSENMEESLAVIILS